MVRILAHIRKHDYPIVCSTMRELTDGITDECGLAIERQLLRFNDQDLELHLNEKVDEYYGMQHNDRVYVYNKGGYYTKTSPLKHERVSILQRLQEEANEIPGRWAAPIMVDCK
jgi:cytochrome oxidase Cu insertion factor (SCO1/SenC/PrrC family)